MAAIFANFATFYITNTNWDTFKHVFQVFCRVIDLNYEANQIDWEFNYSTNQVKFFLGATHYWQQIPFPDFDLRNVHVRVDLIDKMSVKLSVCCDKKLTTVTGNLSIGETFVIERRWWEKWSHKYRFVVRVLDPQYTADQIGWEMRPNNNQIKFYLGPTYYWENIPLNFNDLSKTNLVVEYIDQMSADLAVCYDWLYMGENDNTTYPIGGDGNYWKK